MANGSQEEFVSEASQFSVEVSGHSHLVFSKLRQFQEVVFWERPEIPEFTPTDLDVIVPLQVHDRPDNMAFFVYGDSLLWWVLSVANDIRLQPLQMNPGFQFRLPSADAVIKTIREGPRL